MVRAQFGVRKSYARLQSRGRQSLERTCAYAGKTRALDSACGLGRIDVSYVLILTRPRRNDGNGHRHGGHQRGRAARRRKSYRDQPVAVVDGFDRRLGPLLAAFAGTRHVHVRRFEARLRNRDDDRHLGLRRSVAEPALSLGTGAENDCDRDDTIVDGRRETGHDQRRLFGQRDRHASRRRRRRRRQFEQRLLGDRDDTRRVRSARTSKDGIRSSTSAAATSIKSATSSTACRSTVRSTTIRAERPARSASKSCSSTPAAERSAKARAASPASSTKSSRPAPIPATPP